MKRALFAVLLLIFAASLAAQTGIFGISFGQTFTDLDKMLKSKGFSEFKTDKEAKIYTNSTIENFVEVQIYLDSVTNKVSSWFAYFYNDDSDKAYDSAMTVLSDIHGIYIIWDDIDEVYVWELDSYKAVYLYESTGGDWIAEYSDWDEYYDDDYWWY